MFTNQAARQGIRENLLETGSQVETKTKPMTKEASKTARIMDMMSSIFKSTPKPEDDGREYVQMK